tara:strand:+ start:148 stop:486 length:339 start_codon:yes stop_codon:yes gene_type:complete
MIPIDEYDFPFIPITEETFERQGWEMVVSKEELESGEIDEFYYFTLPLPKDNPSKKAKCLISSINDDYQEFDFLKKGEYLVELEGEGGLGLCRTEEELEILYRGLTRLEIED